THDSIAEVLDHCCDREGAAEAFVQTRFRHFLPPRQFRRFALEASHWVRVGLESDSRPGCSRPETPAGNQSTSSCPWARAKRRELEDVRRVTSLQGSSDVGGIQAEWSLQRAVQYAPLSWLALRSRFSPGHLPVIGRRPLEVYNACSPSSTKEEIAE